MIYEDEEEFEEQNEDEEEPKESETKKETKEKNISKAYSKAFFDTIKDYLDSFALQDLSFAEKLKNPNKNIDYCCGFIVDSVRKMKVNGLTDQEVFSLARHYYNEEDVKGTSFKKQSAKILVNHEVVLSEEDKTKLQEKAMEEYQKKCMEDLKLRSEKEKKKLEKKIEQQKQKAKDSGQMSLFEYVE